jgi:hypothetical protein
MAGLFAADGSLIRVSSISTICCPIRSVGWWTAVSAGSERRAMVESSKPMTATSSGDASSLPLQYAQRAGGHVVVRGEHRVQERFAFEEFPHGDGTAGLAEAAVGHQFRGAGQGLPISGKPVDAHGGVR